MKGARNRPRDSRQCRHFRRHPNLRDLNGHRVRMFLSRPRTTIISIKGSGQTHTHHRRRRLQVQVARAGNRQHSSTKHNNRNRNHQANDGTRRHNRRPARSRQQRIGGLHRTSSLVNSTNIRRGPIRATTNTSRRNGTNNQHRTFINRFRSQFATRTLHRARNPRTRRHHRRRNSRQITSGRRRLVRTTTQHKGRINPTTGRRRRRQRRGNHRNSTRAQRPVAQLTIRGLPFRQIVYQRISTQRSRFNMRQPNSGHHQGAGRGHMRRHLSSQHLVHLRHRRHHQI